MSFSLHALETALAVYLMKKMLKRELFSLLLQKDLIEHDLVNGEECECLCYEEKKVNNKTSQNNKMDPVLGSAGSIC